MVLGKAEGATGEPVTPPGALPTEPADFFGLTCAGKPGQVWHPIAVKSVPTPQPAGDQVLVRIHAAALNHREVFIRQCESACFSALIVVDPVPRTDRVPPRVTVTPSTLSWRHLRLYPWRRRSRRCRLAFVPPAIQQASPALARGGVAQLHLWTRHWQGVWHPRWHKADAGQRHVCTVYRCWRAGRCRLSVAPTGGQEWLGKRRRASSGGPDGIQVSSIFLDYG